MPRLRILNTRGWCWVENFWTCRGKRLNWSKDCLHSLQMIGPRHQRTLLIVFVVEAMLYFLIISCTCPKTAYLDRQIRCTDRLDRQIDTVSTSLLAFALYYTKVSVFFLAIPVGLCILCCSSRPLCRPPGYCLNMFTARWISAGLTFQRHGKGKAKPTVKRHTEVQTYIGGCLHCFGDKINYLQRT